MLNTLVSHLLWANDQQTWQGGDSGWGASTHEFIQPFKYVLTRGHVTKTYLHYHNGFSHKAYQGGVIPQRVPTHKFNILNINSIYYISTCRRPMGTKWGMLLTYSERLPSCKPQNLLITWVTWGHVKIGKFYISTIKRFKASKPGRVLSYKRRFGMQTLTWTSTSCFFFKSVGWFLYDWCITRKCQVTLFANNRSSVAYSVPCLEPCQTYKMDLK